jgi:hypothetical protein
MFVRAGIRKPIEFIEARRMRSLGFSYKVIARTLGISPSSAFNWTHDIDLTEGQRWELLYGPRGPWHPADVARRAETWRLKNQAHRRGWQLQGRERARATDPLHMAGCMLYWAEGAKNRNNVLIANSDLHLIRFFKVFLTECFEIPEEDLTLRLNVYLGNGMSLRAIEDRWLDGLGLSRASLRRHTINHFPTSSSGRKRARLPYGVGFLRVLRSTWLAQHIYGAIQEYGGFEEPRWLDGHRSGSGPEPTVGA